MIAFDRGQPDLIQHFTKVHAYAKLIGELEQIDPSVQTVLEAAALVHDIGIPLCGADKAYHHFRGRCPHAHNGKADYEFTEAEFPCNCRCTFYQIICPKDHQGQTNQEQYDLNPHPFFNLSTKLAIISYFYYFC